MRRAVVIAGAVVGALFLVGTATFAPLVRARAEGAAAALGLRVSVAGVAPRWLGVRLTDVTLELKEAPSIRIRLDRIDVELGLSFRPSAVVAWGGGLVVSGETDVVLTELRAWRNAQLSGDSEPVAKRALALEARDLSVRWESATGRISAERVRARRASDGALTMEAEALVGAYGQVAFSTRDLAVRLGRGVGGRVVEELSGKALEIDVRLGSEGVRVAADPVQSVGAAAALGDGTLGAALRAGLSRVAEVGGRYLAESGEVNVAGVRLRIRQGDQVLNLGPSRLRVSRDRPALRARLTPESAAPGPPSLAVEAELPIEAGPFKLEVDGGPVALQALGVQEGDFGLRDVERALLEARGRVELPRVGPDAEISGSGRLQRLSLKHAALSRDVVTNVDLGWDLRAKVSLDGRRVDLAALSVRLGEVTGAVSGSWFHENGALAITGNLDLPLAACHDLLNAVPTGLVPLLSGMKMRGTFSLRGELAFDSRSPLGTRVDLEMRNNCKIDEYSPTVAPERFLAPFRRVVRNAEGQDVEVMVGPDTPTWLPYHMISANLVTAVLVCEDGHFFSHDGFDVKALRNSVRDNLSAGRFMRGASTISMQLAKNLYLSSEKTLSRKLQEAVLTLLLEQELSKHEMIELYLNIIEYAPGVYGAGPAAQHYFGTTAADLSLGQALYIASVLPNPRRQYFVRDGRVSKRWSEYLRTLMGVARRIGRITDEELATGLLEQIEFQVPRPTLIREASSGETEPSEDGMDPAVGGAPPEPKDEATATKPKDTESQRPLPSGLTSPPPAASTPSASHRPPKPLGKPVVPRR